MLLIRKSIFCLGLVLTGAWFFLTAAGLSAAGAKDLSYLELQSGRVTLFCQAQDSLVARQYVSWAAEFRPAPSFLAAMPLKVLRIYVAPDEEEFQRLSGGLLPEWGAACALPEEDLVIVRSPRLVPLWKEDPRRILLHEISHVFLDQQLRPARIPRWFQEGYAVYNAEMWDLEDTFDVSVALAVGAFLPFDELNRGFPQGETRAHRAYLQSYTVIEYLFTHWKADQLDLLFQRWRDMGDLDQAMRQSWGLTLMQFETGWQEWVQVRYGWFKLLSSTTLLWIVAGLLFLAVFITRRARYYRKLEELKKFEGASPEHGPWDTEQDVPEDFEGDFPENSPHRRRPL
jgi:hypothetical protein